MISFQFYLEKFYLADEERKSFSSNEATIFDQKNFFDFHVESVKSYFWSALALWEQTKDSCDSDLFSKTFPPRLIESFRCFCVMQATTRTSAMTFDWHRFVKPWQHPIKAGFRLCSLVSMETNPNFIFLNTICESFCVFFLHKCNTSNPAEV